MVQAPVEMAPAGMVEINPAAEPAAAPPNPDEKKTPEKIKYKGEIISLYPRIRGRKINRLYNH